MPVFFQKISDDQFNAESDFVVKESKKIHLIFGIFFFVISLAGFSMSPIISGFGLLIAIAALVRSSKDQTIMKVNKNGIYYYGQLVTDWNHFITLEFKDEIPTPSYGTDGINDEFSLMIKYYKDGFPDYYGRKIRLTNSQDKSEEEIIAAIKFYYSQNVIQ